MSRLWSLVSSALGRFCISILNRFPHEDQGWKQIDETFIRYKIIETRLFRVYVHYLVAPTAHTHCHDHPWSFVTFLIKGGYFEYTESTGWVWRKPLRIHYRPANWLHNVTTFGDSWSLIITGPKAHEWGFKHCRRVNGPAHDFPPDKVEL